MCHVSKDGWGATMQQEEQGQCEEVRGWEGWRVQVGGAHWLADRPPVAAPQYADGEPREVEAVIDVVAQYNVLPGGALRLQYNVDARRALPAKLPPGLFGYVRVRTSVTCPCFCLRLRVLCKFDVRVYVRGCICAMRSIFERLPSLQQGYSCAYSSC